MKRALLVGVGVLVTLAGVIFTLQGLGAIGGSAMSGVPAQRSRSQLDCLPGYRG